MESRTRKGRSASADRRWVRHPLYGEIRQIRRSTVGRDGRTYEWWEHDPAFFPPVPKGAVAGDVSKQVFCAACHDPKYFYVDEAQSCLQCGSRFTFSAAEQKHWYETRQFNFGLVPIRCQNCRRQRRTEHALREQLARARQLTRDAPGDPSGHLALARAIVEYHERTGAGRLDDAVAAARRAGKIWRDAPDATLWEGVAHARAGRAKQARECLSRFLADSKNVNASLQLKARTYLAQLDGTS